MKIYSFFQKAPIILCNSFFVLFSILPLSFILGPGPWNINFFFLSILGLFIFFLHYSEIKKLIFENKFLLYLLLFFSIYIIINSLYSEYRVESLSRSIPFIKYFFIFLGIFVVKNKIEFNNIKLNFYLIILGFSILIVLLSSTAELFRLDLPIYTKSTVNYRLNGPFGDEAIVGSYLFSFLPSIIFMFETNNFKRTLKIIIISLIYFIIIASGERMVIIMSTILLFFYLVPKYSKTLFICLSMSILVLALTISFKSIIFKNEYHDSYLFRIEQTLREFSDPFNTSYFIHYKTALEIFKNHKIFGAGVKSYRYECSKDKYDMFTQTQTKDVVLLHIIYI